MVGLICKQLLLAALVLSTGTTSSGASQSSEDSYPVGDVRNCLQGSDGSRYQMEVLPGVGFDNLRNLDMGRVLQLSYSNCQVSKDGKYLLPDNFYLIPVQESKVNVFAEYIDHWDQYTSMTSISINVGVGGSYEKISGKFSAGYTTTKTHMYNSNNLARNTRTQVRVKRYTARLEPGAQLDHNFVSRLLDIVESIDSNRTGSAHYLSELLVRDYGTHYLYSMDAGGVLSKSDFIKETSDNSISTNSDDIKVSASISFMKLISLSTSFEYKKNETSQQKYVDNQVHSEVSTIGGGPFVGNMTLREWESQLDDSLVAIDRSGEPLHLLINPTTLPSLPETTVFSLANYVEKAIKRYYRVNTRVGCTEPKSPNFNFQANLNDSNCKPPLTNLSFGGIFQTCEQLQGQEDLCTDIVQSNPLTGDASCPSNYEAVPLHSGKISRVKKSQSCRRVCYHHGFWNMVKSCDNKCVDVFSTSRAQYEASWCVATSPVLPSSGYLFGGLYTSTTSNPLTGSTSCPHYFIPLKMGEDIRVCVSDEYELAPSYAIHFGGFESCKAGNPLAEHSSNASPPHACPHGFTQHLVAVEDGCEINYCLHLDALKHVSLMGIRSPPFHKPPKHHPNSSYTMAILGLHGEVWVKNGDGQWEEIQTGNAETAWELLASFGFQLPGTGGGISKGGIAGITIAVTLVLGILIVGVIFAGRRLYKFRKGKQEYTTLSSVN